MAQRVQEQQRRLRAHNEEMQGMLERLHRADQLKDEFLSFFSHELRTPLSAIRSFAELLRITGDIEEEDRREFLTIIESECERLTRLSTDLLDLAKIESGDMPWRERVLRPHDFLQPALKTLKVLAEKGGVHLMLQHDAVLPRIVADVDRLTQVVTNLVSNALKFTPPGGQVTVRASGGRRADGTPVLGITVQDTGPGIPQEYLERVFDRYVQAPDTQAGNVRGTGLGLTICKRVVQHYSGTIQAANHPNGGALFHITLPACEPPGTEPDGVDTLERLEAQSVGARADAQ
jgi:signal transduction histidine kinase